MNLYACAGVEQNVKLSSNKSLHFTKHRCIILYTGGNMGKKDDKEKETLALVNGILARNDTKKNAQELRSKCNHDKTFISDGKCYCSNCWALIGNA